MWSVFSCCSLNHQVVCGVCSSKRRTSPYVCATSASKLRLASGLAGTYVLCPHYLNYLSLLWKLKVESSNSLAVLYCRRPSFSFIVRGGLARRSSLVRFIIPGLLPASGSDDLVPSLKEVLRILLESTSFMMLKEHS
jgi:hypothetical protein